MLELDRKTFEAEVLEAEGKVFVDYYGDGCGPCKAIRPFIDEMAEKYGDQLKFTALNTSGARRLAISQRIMGLPVVAIYENGEKIESLDGAEQCTPENIENLIKKHI